MGTQERVEKFLYELTLTFESVGEGAWVINDAEKGLQNVVVLVEEPLVIVRVKVMDLPENNREKFFEQLLRLNASDLVHGAYALEGDNVILVNTLFADTIDLEEFQSTLDAISLALAQHYEVLAGYRSQ